MPTRREFYQTGSMILGTLMGFLLAIPGVAYVLDPLRKKGAATKTYPIARLDDLQVGVPRSYPIVDERQDAWVKYPKEPIGLIWLIRQPDGTPNPVIAFTAECPHLGCAVNLSADKKSFRCPCHDSAFTFDGKPENKVPPRGMDRLDVDPLAVDRMIRVKFERFRAQSEEKIPLA